MKQKDYILIAIIVFLGAIISIGISKVFIGGEKTIQKAEVVQPISADFPEPDKKYFNSEAFNPTLTIEIEDNDNTAPFENKTTP